MTSHETGRPQGTLSWVCHHQDRLAYGVLVVVFLIIALAAPHAGEHYGAWSLLPPAALFCFVLGTRRVIEGFFWGSVLAVFMTHRGDLLTAYNDNLFTQLTNADNLWLIVTLLSIGALVTVLERSGLSHEFGLWAASKARTPRAAGVVTLLVSLFLSQDGYLSISTTGAALTEANEKLGRPRLFTAYLVRTGAIPGSAFNPLATGSVFVAGLLVTNGYVAKGDEVAGYAQLIPYMFYPMAALLVGFLVATGVIRPFGAMRRALDEHAAPSAPENGERQGNSGRKLANFFLVLVVLVASTLIADSIQLGLLITLLAGAVLFVGQRWFTPDSYLEAVVDGMKEMLSLALIMAMAFVFVAAINDTGFTDFVISGVSDSVPARLLPVVIFLLFGLTEFLVTLNWSLYLLALPVVIPLSAQIGAHQNLTVAALISAGLWGATACITSDVGLLNTYTTKVDVFRHWISNLPFQFIAWVIAAVAFLAAGLVLT